jgi:hypothetical protein
MPRDVRGSRAARRVVTNGVDTGRFEVEDFDRLSAWD